MTDLDMKFLLNMKIKYTMSMVYQDGTMGLSSCH